MNKLMPILAKAVVLPAVLTISTLGGKAQTLNHPVDANAGDGAYEVLYSLDNEVIESADGGVKSIAVLDEIVPVNFDQQLIALDYQRGVVVLDLAANQILEVAEIQPLDRLDIVGTNNR